MGESAKTACLIHNLDHADCYSKFSPFPIEDLVSDMDGGECDIVFIRWNDYQLCIDRYAGWAYSDVTKPPEDERSASGWKIVSPRFKSFSEALDYPILDGKSSSERWDECELYD